MHIYMTPFLLFKYAHILHYFGKICNYYFGSVFAPRLPYTLTPAFHFFVRTAMVSILYVPANMSTAQARSTI